MKKTLLSFVACVAIAGCSTMAANSPVKTVDGVLVGALHIHDLTRAKVI